MDGRSVFHVISDITHKEGVACILIGGFAVNHYKVARQTLDVDFLITKEDFEKIVGALEKAGYAKGQSQENFAQLKSNRVSLMNTDFMFVEKKTLEEILKESQEIKIAGQKFLVPSLLHLIALKLHSIKHNFKLRYAKDFPDIVSLIRANKVDIADKKFKEICTRYGTDEIYKKIMELVQ